MSAYKQGHCVHLRPLGIGTSCELCADTLAAEAAARRRAEQERLRLEVVGNGVMRALAGKGHPHPDVPWVDVRE